VFLRAARSLVDVRDPFAGLPVRGLAIVAIEAGDLVAAARIWGATEATTPLYPGTWAFEAQLVEGARQVLGEQFDREVQVGRAMSLEEAVNLATAIEM
jgi:hypothetical protein